MHSRRHLCTLLCLAALCGCTADVGRPTSLSTSRTTSSTAAPVSLDGFQPLGAPGCRPASPFQPWGGDMAEVRATPEDIEVWGLLWQVPPLSPNEEIKMVWRVTGSGSLDIEATQDDSHADPRWGPVLHSGSNFERPGDEWGTAFAFPSSGCWEITIKRGRGSAHVWVEVGS